MKTTLSDLQNLCKKLKAVTQDIKWENHLCFNVGGKMFLITSPDTVPVTASIKVCEKDFEELSDTNGFRPAPYLARYKWIFVDDINNLEINEWKRLIENAYLLVASKLPARIKKEISFVG